MSQTEDAIADHLSDYLAVMTELEAKLPDTDRDHLQQIIHLVAVASNDLPLRTAEFLLTLVTVCPSLTLS